MRKMKFNGTVVLFYGIIVLLGGLIGYLVAGSIASLIAGTLCGAILVACGFGLYRVSVLAYFVALSVSALLTLFFSYRLYTTEKLMPSGIMTALSLLVVILLLSTRGTRKSFTKG